MILAWDAGGTVGETSCLDSRAREITEYEQSPTEGEESKCSDSAEYRPGRNYGSCLPLNLVSMGIHQKLK